MDYVLGLDLGCSSVGWAMVQHTNGHPVGLLATGVRVFPEGKLLEKGREESRNKQRRDARQARRQRHRRRQRRRKLTAVLQSAGFLPTTSEQLKEVLTREPYGLRVKALDEKLAPYELGRVLYHLNRRRGFKSNRKTDKGKDDGKVLSAITELQEKIKAAGCRTLGEYLHTFVPAEGQSHAAAAPVGRARKRYTLRKMYADEFDAIWGKQKQYHPHILTDDLKTTLADHVIFFQRPLRDQSELVGPCEFEPDQKRCPRADRQAQRFRLLQEVNNLIITTTGEVLSDEQRTALIDALSGKRRMSFDDIRKLLALDKDDTFNLEGPKRKGLQGNITEAEFGKSTVFGKRWRQMDEATRDDIVATFRRIEDPEELAQIGKAQWQLNDKQVETLLKIDLLEGYSRLSREAMDKLVPYLEEGLLYTDALDRAYPDWKDRHKGDHQDSLPPVEDLRNPMVQRALTETRRVVNAIVKRYGKPSRIVVELTRDLKASVQHRQDMILQQKENQDRNERAAEAIRKEFGKSRVSAADLERYKLWEELGPNHLCPYTGKPIPAARLFTPDVEVDHILPFRRSLDNSFANKVLCYATANRDKGEQTPYEWLGEGSEDYERMCNVIKGFVGPRAWRKRAKFTQKEIDTDTCIERQLNDTRYISRKATEHLKTLGVPVACSKGGATAELRYHWGLNSILNDDGGNRKNRNDHRHHAIDALVTALTGPRHLQQLARTRAVRPESLPDPWPNFHRSVQDKIEAVRVSYRVDRKVSGPLHEETAYGPTDCENVYVYRKAVDELTGPMVKEIRDPVVQAQVRQALDDAGLDPDNPPATIPKGTFDTLAMPSGVPIKKVRMTTVATNLIGIDKMQARRGTPYKFVKPGENHHIEIYEYANGKKKGKRDGVVVSRFEAAQRAKKGLPIINRDHGPDTKFIMSLAINEMVMLTMPDGSEELYRVQKLDAGNTRFTLRKHTSADINDPATRQNKRPNSMVGRKVSVDPLGDVHPTND